MQANAKQKDQTMRFTIFLATVAVLAFAATAATAQDSTPAACRNEHAGHMMGGSGMGSDLLVAWPGAELGFMDPVVGANVLYGDQLDALSTDDRRAELHRMAAELGADTDPRSIAAAMNIDEVIDPADTRAILATELGRLCSHPPPRPSDLAAWPHWW